MAKPTLYLMLGYPGAGKTTTARAISEVTGAAHLWADQVRRKVYGKPTYSHEENLDLYNHLNYIAGELLKAGKSVVFDTNFNYYKDRQKLRKIADEQGAKTWLVWVTTSRELARQRATDGAKEGQNTRILGDLPTDTFDRLSDELQPPKAGEQTISIDGTKVSVDYVRQALATPSSQKIV